MSGGTNTSGKRAWRHSRRAGALWRTVKWLSVLQLVPLALFWWVRDLYRTHEPGKRVEAIVWAPDGKRLYGSGRLRTPYLAGQGEAFVAAWDAQTGRILWELPYPANGGKTEFVEDVSPDGRWLLLRSWDGDAALVRDARNGKLLYRVPGAYGEGTQEICFTREGYGIVVVTSSAIQLWDFGQSGTYEPVWKRDMPGDEMCHATPIAPRAQEPGELLVTRDGEWVSDRFFPGAVELWNLRDGKKRITLARGNYPFATVTPDGKQVVVGGRESKGLSLYDRKSGRALGRIVPNVHRPVTDVKILKSVGGVLEADLSAPTSDKFYTAPLRWNVREDRFRVGGFAWQRATRGSVRSPDGTQYAQINWGSGKKHPPLVTLVQADPRNKREHNLEGEAGWRP